MWLYDIIIRLVVFLATLIRPFSNKVDQFFVQRKNWKKELIQLVEQLNLDKVSAAKSAQHLIASKRIWVHVSSLGEYEQGMPIMSQLKKEGHQIIVSFFSASGYDQIAPKNPWDGVLYLPVDTSSNARDFVKNLEPDLAIFVKYEFWYNFIDQIHRHEIPLISVSTILRSDQVFFQWYGGLFKKGLLKFDHFFVQNIETKRLLNTIGKVEVSISGDTRSDRVFAKAKTVKKLPILNSFKSHQGKVLVVGSSWPDDLEVILEPISKMLKEYPDFKVVFAPHEIREEGLTTLIEYFDDQKVPSFLYSQIDDVAFFDNQRVLIIDSIGILFHAYQYADLVFIGGGYKDGLHNILEPSVFKKSVIFGDLKYKKFQEAIDLIDFGGAKTIANKTVCYEELKLIFNNPNLLNNRGLINYNYILDSLGATKKITTKMDQLLNQKS